MKKILSYSFLVILIFCISLGYALPTHDSGFFCDKNGTPTPAVSRLFDHLGVSISSLEQAHDFAQKNLLRKGERWDVQAEKEWHTAMRDKKELLLQDLKALGMIDSVEPAQTEYVYILVMGALKRTVLQRLDHLAKLKQQGLVFKEIVLLGGERQLQDNEKEGLPPEIITEAQMMLYLCTHHPILSNEKNILINAPMIKNSDGTLSRPTTDSTLVHFALNAPTPGSCLVISNNPYVIRQTKVAQRILDQHSFPTQGAGPAVNLEALDIVILMDEFARTLYEEYKATHQ